MSFAPRLRLAAGLAVLTLPGLAQNAPTFTKDVAPILYKHCSNCHREGEIGPMTLLAYEQVRPWAKAIRDRVARGLMPPWHAEAPRGTFLNDRRLTEAERSALVAWADAGAPRGNPADLPPAPKFAEGWEIGTPDVVLTMPKPYEVPASGTIEYQLFTIPTNFTEDKWVQAIEVKPGARKVVHHILVFSRPPQNSTAARTAAFVQTIPKVERGRSGGGEGPGTLIATTAPGTNAMVYSPGEAMRVPAGSTLVLQVHYTTNGKGETDRSSVGMIFAKEPPQREIHNTAILNAMLKIPAGSPDQAIDTAIEFTQDVHITALFPHTHLRGKTWEYRLLYPDGRSQVVLSVPKYDFNWQTYYIYSEPLAVPKGSRLEATAHYDNSPNNPANPDPKVDVRWGNQTWQEMQYSGITYYVDPAAASPSGIGGKWTGELKIPTGQTLPVTFDFKPEGAKVAGTVTLPMGDFAIDNGALEADTLHFGLNVDTGGRKLVFQGTGKLATADQLKINLNGPMNLDIDLKRP
jgi:hypothetical protein